MSIEKHLTLGQEGGCLLFCGAGFSADCLNFSNEELGVASPLLKALNDALDFEYVDLQDAADEYMDREGEHGLLTLLKQKYSVTKRTTDTDTILSFPWDRIYTTNYDDVISLALTELGIDHDIANNLEPKWSFDKRASSEQWIVHLHGSLRAWDINNFRESCVLGRESYMRIADSNNWNAALREDFARAKSIFFVGFSNSDFYLAEALFSAAGSKEKVFFINRESSGSDRNLLAKQKRFGHSLSVGKSGFASSIGKVLREKVDVPLVTNSFLRQQLPTLPPAAASVPEQESFLMYGQYDSALHYKDFFDRKNSFRASRSRSVEVVEHLTSQNSVALVLGGICSGKSVFLEEVNIGLSAAGETVYFLRQKYHDLVREAQRIIEQNPNAVFVIDDCFTLRDELPRLLGILNGAGARILLASRTLPHDSEIDLQTVLLEDTPFKTFDTEQLDDSEVTSIVECTNRVGGWGTDASTDGQKIKIVQKDHASRLSGFLLGRFQSPHIRDRFTAELDQFKTRGLPAVDTLILAFYLRHMGEAVHVRVLDELCGSDSVSHLIQDAPSHFVTLNSALSSFELIASVNARDVLANLFDDREIVLAVIDALERIAPLRSQYVYKSIYSQMMRYTQLKHVVVKESERNFFFDRLSEYSFCQNHILFWLQWSMAMRDQEQFARAKQYLDEAYGRARRTDDYDTHHLDDQKAGLMLDAAKLNESSANYLRTFNEAIGILSRLVGRPDQTSHPYLTMKSLRSFFDKAKPVLVTPHKSLIAQSITVLKNQVETRSRSQQIGYVKDAMVSASEICEGIANDCR